MSGGGPDQRRPDQHQAGHGDDRLGAPGNTDSLFGGHFDDQPPTAELSVDQILTRRENAVEPGPRAQQNAPITGSVPVVVIPRSQRYLELAHRWRSLLGFALAAVITGAAVVSYQSAADSGSTIELEATSSDLTVVSAPEDVVEPSGPAASNDEAATAEDNENDDPGVVSEAEQVAGAVPEATRPTITEPTSTDDLDAGDESVSASSTSITDPDATTSSIEAEATTVAPEATTTTGAIAPAKVRVEAELGVVTGTARVRSDHIGFSGTGFVGDIITPDSSVAITIDSPTGGPTPFSLRYSAGPTTPDGQPTPDGLRTLTVLVNGTVVSEAQMRQTPTWDDWDVVTGELALEAGPNVVTILLGPGNTGWANIDYIEIN